MTNDELLAKLYDGTLTEGERTTLEQRIQDSPEFAGEVAEFETVVDLMDKSSEDDEPKPALLSSTKEKVVALIGAAAGTATLGGAASQMGGSLFSSAAAQWAAGIIGALAVGGVAYWAVTDDDTPALPDGEPALVQQQDSQENPSNSIGNDDLPGNPDPDAELPVNTDQQAADTQEPQSIPALGSDMTEDPSEIPSDTDAIAPNSEGHSELEPQYGDMILESKDPAIQVLELANDADAGAVEQMRALGNTTEEAHFLARIADRMTRLKNYQEAFDKAGRAIDLLENGTSDPDLARALYARGAASIGLGNLEAAEQDLGNAESLAKANNLTELRGKIIGQRGLLALAQGDINTALQNVTTSVEVLRNAGSKSIERGVWEDWQKTLRQKMLEEN